MLSCDSSYNKEAKVGIGQEMAHNRNIALEQSVIYKFWKPHFVFHLLQKYLLTNKIHQTVNISENGYQIMFKDVRCQ